MARIKAVIRRDEDGWTAHVTVVDRVTTEHDVRITKADQERYGDEVGDLVHRSFEFLLARESNTSILREFSLSTIERYFPEYAEEVRRG